MNPLITVKNVHYRYAGREVVRGASFTLLPGEIAILTGASGSGKSTLLRLAVGLLQPQQGTVVTSARRVGIVFQEPRLLPWYTVLENIMYPLACRRKQAEEHAERLVHSLGLAAAAHLYPAQLSGGMKQRVSLARALIVEPDVLLLNEPFTGLDNKIRSDIRALLAETVAAKGAGILQVTHHFEEAIEPVKSVYRVCDGCMTMEAEI